jgi:hypothetical protein
LLLEVSTPQQGPELHLDVAAQQEPLLLLGVTILQRHVLHLDLSAKQRPAPGRVQTAGACADLDMSIPLGPELNLYVSTPHGPELHLDLSGQKEPILTLDGGRVYTTRA